jgi:hypothetical protein
MLVRLKYSRQGRRGEEMGIEIWLDTKASIASVELRFELQ